MRLQQQLKMLCAIYLFANTAYSSPFEDCPAEAFLIQDKISTLYGVQLATGYYHKISPVDWGQDKMNALAFSVHDSHLYAYNYYFGTIVRISSEFDLQPLWLKDLPNIGFYVGDMSINRNSYYLYRPGGNYGLYEISMDPQNNEYLTAKKIVSGNLLSMSIFDIAFHPSNGFAYSVDQWGNLWKVDVEKGTGEKLSNVGQSGTFGAVYFDVDGRLYISRNSDGNIFRVDTNWDYPKAEFFAFGPPSSNNDGARCALAPLVSLGEPTTDFGDAPDSYGSSINNNGARHDIGDGTLYLGKSVSLEPNAYATNGSAINDNDGVTFVTAFEVGRKALVEVEAAKDGYLNAWTDWDGNGKFDQDEQIAKDKWLVAGKNNLVVDVPTWSKPVKTWSRFRLSSLQGLEPTGGVFDGEVEDYAIEINAQNVSVDFYPSENNWATLAFEDNWPLNGDYDMNDVVVRYRLSAYQSLGNTLQVKFEGELVAMGAAYHNGFAFRIPGLQRSDVDENRLEMFVNGSRIQTSPLEANREEAIFIIAEDLWDYVTPGEGCSHYRTQANCGSNIQFSFSLLVPLVNSVVNSQLAGFPYDPFIFSSPTERRSYVFGEAPGRRYEIHLQNMPPTEAFQENFFGRGDDDSNPDQNRYYVNKNGMPWALNIPYSWQHPLEYIDIKFAYPQFHEYVVSAGAEKKTWYFSENSQDKNVFKK